MNSLLNWTIANPTEATLTYIFVAGIFIIAAIKWRNRNFEYANKTAAYLVGLSLVPKGFSQYDIIDATQKKTPWFAPTEKPARSGVYPAYRSGYYAYWCDDTQRWGVSAPSVEGALQKWDQYGSTNVDQSKPWCGFVVEQKL